MEADRGDAGTPGTDSGEPASCPGTALDNQSTCATGGGPCPYGDVVCDRPGNAACTMLGSCAYDGGIECSCGAAIGPSGGMDTHARGTCPATKPTGTCTTEHLACSYGTTSCTCRRGGMASASASCVEWTGGVAGCSYGAASCSPRGARLPSPPQTQEPRSARSCPLPIA